MVQNIINQEQLVTYIEDATKRFTRVFDVKLIESQKDLLILALPRKTSKLPESLKSPWAPKVNRLNCIATVLARTTNHKFIYGDALIFHKSPEGHIEYLTKDEALGIAQEIKGQED